MDQQQHQQAWPSSIVSSSLAESEHPVQRYALQSFCAEVASDPSHFLNEFIRAKQDNFVDWLAQHSFTLSRIFAQAHPEMLQEWIQTNYVHHPENGRIVNIRECFPLDSTNIQAAQPASHNQIPTVPVTDALDMNGNVMSGNVSNNNATKCNVIKDDPTSKHSTDDDATECNATDDDASDEDSTDDNASDFEVTPVMQDQAKHSSKAKAKSKPRKVENQKRRKSLSKTKQKQMDMDRDKQLREVFKKLTGRTRPTAIVGFQHFWKDNPSFGKCREKAGRAYRRLRSKDKAHYRKIYADLRADYDKEFTKFKRVSSL